MTDLRNRNKNDLYCALVMLLLGIICMINTFMAVGWSKATGNAAKMFPRLIISLLIVVACVLLIKTLFGKNQVPAEAMQVKLWHIVVFIAIGIVSFEIIVNVGVAVGILISLLSLVCLFDEEPKKHFKTNIIYVVVATAVLFLIFTKVLPVVTIRQILF